MSEHPILSPVRPEVLEVARRAFIGLRHGAGTGDWGDFEELLVPDARAMVPISAAEVDGPEGLITGRDEIVRKLGAHHATMVGTIDLQCMQLAGGGDVVTMECRAEGERSGARVANHYFLAFEVRGDAIASFYQYATWSDLSISSGWRRPGFARDAFTVALDPDQLGFGVAAFGLCKPSLDAVDVATKAFLGLERGSGVGDWSGFIDQLADDARMIIPVPAEVEGGPEGLVCGKQAIGLVFGSHHQETNKGASLEAMRLTGDGDRIAMECRVEGELSGEEVANFLVFVFEIAGGRVATMREYANWTAKSATSRWTELDFAREAFAYAIIPVDPALADHV